MDQNNLFPNPQSSDSQDEEGDSLRTERNPSLTCEEQTQEDTGPATSRYCSMMDDECPEEVFVHPLPLLSRLDPEGGSTFEEATHPCFTAGPSDATEADANPECLDWHHGEKHLMTAHSQVNEEMESPLPKTAKATRSDSSSGIESSGQDLTLMESRLSFEDTLVQDYHYKSEYKGDGFGMPGGEIVNEELFKSSVDADLLEETKSKNVCENLDRHDATSQDTEIVPEENKMESTLNERPDILRRQSDDSDLPDTVSLDSDLTGYDWVRRTSEEGPDEGLNDEPRGLDEKDEESPKDADDSRKIATEILQGENLLQRLQLVQQDLSECQSSSSQNQPAEDGSIVDEEVVREEPEITQGIQWQEHTEPETKAESPLSTVTVQFEDCKIDKTEEDITCNKDKTIAGEEETEDMNDETNPGASFSTLSALKKEARCIEEPWKSSHENKNAFLSYHRFSAAETFMEKQFQEASQKRLDLQRAGGVFDLTDNPDVLEIPFKTSISLEHIPARDQSPGQRGDWQFSEQKMQKEISQDLQRELVMVNQGRIPGGYSKGECRQIKATKMLFEAFQQDNMEGPTRIRKPQAKLLKGQVFPSVLERTRSLEMFSHKASPMLRTHSFHLVSSAANEKEKSPENLRSQSPSGGTRDKARLSPYRKHDKHARMHKSMDSISTGSSTAGDKGRWSKERPPREGSPLLKENPFFKLRPALSLQPEVEKDIREAKKREEELRKQRCTLYGETKQSSKEDLKAASALRTDPKLKTTGKLERVWPPPSKKDLTKSEQEARVQRGAAHRAPLWQRWEAGLINAHTPPARDSSN